MQITKEQSAQFRKDLETAMRKLHDPEHGWDVPEETSKAECYDAPDSFIAHLIETGADPDGWAYTILM